MIFEGNTDLVNPGLKCHKFGGYVGFKERKNAFESTKKPAFEAAYKPPVSPYIRCRLQR